METEQYSNITKKEHKIDRNFRLTLFVLLIWLNTNILFPGEFGSLKTILSIFLSLLGIWNIIRTKLLPDFKIILGLIIFEFFTFLSIWYGESNGYENGNATMVFMIRPLLIILIISGLSISNDKKAFFFLLDISAAILLIYNFIYVMGALGVIPQLLFWELDNGNVTSMSTTFIAARLTNQGALSFFLPYVAIRLQHYPKKFNWFFVSFIVGMIAAILSGRRIVQIIAIAVLLYVILHIQSITIENILKTFIKTIIIIGSLILFGYIFSNIMGIQNIFVTIYETIANAFNSDTASSLIRSTQTHYLLDGWKQYPIIGHGLNSYVDTYIRNYDSPWSYEYVYYAFLYQIGIVGVAMLMFMIGGLIKPLFQTISRNEYKSVLIGFLFFLVAAASNPMFTNMWIWVIVLVSYEFAKYELRTKERVNW